MSEISEPTKSSGDKKKGAPSQRVVMVRSTQRGVAQDIVIGPHRLLADESEPTGTDSGPRPHELLTAALGACTSITLTLYARHKGWPLESVNVILKHSKIDAADCDDCETKEGTIDRIERAIELGGDLTVEQRNRLLEIANRCPVYRTLKSEVKVESRLVD